MNRKAMKSYGMFVVLLMVALGARAQSFDLYFANNVTDVENLNDTTIRYPNNGLNWTKVERGTVNVYGNYVEVNAIKQMFASTRMKTKADQQQFWRMRDHSLVCFRINSGDGLTGDYGVEADDGYGKKLTLTVSKYFFSNIPLQERPIVFKVWKMGEVGDTLRFKYASDDWNDSRLYTFQLDSKRQMDGEDYTLEYDLSFTDEKGDLQEEKHYLDLKSKNFQSFYVEEGKSLADIFLMSGSTTTPKEGQKRLRLNLKRLIRGVSPYNKFYNLTLSSRFLLDKHENRELVNFNWVGSGLYELFDTLYVKLKKPNGDDIRSARMNVVQVDEDGNEVTSGAPVKYYGWDESLKVHKVITNGNPAYIEILPPASSNTFFPLLLKYRGCTDPLTNIVDEERCSAEVTAVMGNVNYADFAISNQFFRCLHDEKKVIMFRNQEHALFSLEEYDLSGHAATDEVTFSADGCQQDPKIFKGELIDKYGELVLTFSTPRNGQQALSFPDLTAYDVDNNNAVVQSFRPRDNSSFVRMSKFERDYYDVSYDLTELTPDKKCRLKLTAEDKVYDKLPYFSRFVYNRDEYEKESEETAHALIRGIIDGDSPTVGDYSGEAKAEWSIPINFKWESPIKGLHINTSLYFSFPRKCLDYKICAEYRRMSNHTDEAGDPDDSYVSKMREDITTYRNWDKFGTYWNEEEERYDFSKYKEMKENGFTGSLVSQPGQEKLENWVFEEFDDVFSLPTPGWSISGGIKVAGSLTDLNKYKNKEGDVVGDHQRYPTISDASAYFKLACGAFIPNPFKAIGGRYLGSVGGVLDRFSNWVSVNALSELSLEISVGYKNWQALDYGYGGKAHSLLVQGMVKARGGISAEIHTPPNPVLRVGLGLRAGAKLGLGYGFCTDFGEHNDHGGVFVGLFGIEAFAYVRSLAGTARASAEVHLGDKVLFPNNDNTNPFHKKYPYWAQKVEPVAAPPGKLWQLPRLAADDNSDADTGDTTEDKDIVYGEEIVSNVASNANPHFLDENTIVYNAPSNGDDLNTGHVALMNTKTNTVERLSAEGKRADNHMRSKNTVHEVVVYEEMTRHVDAEELKTDDANATARAAELAQEQSIMSCIRNTTPGADNQWHYYTVSAATGDMVKAKPVVTIQENGHAACIWQQGQILPVSGRTTESTEVGSDAFDTAMNGQLMLSFFNGDQWSEPVKLFDLNEENVARQYDLIMRNDTALVGVNMTRYFYDDQKRSNQFTYASVPLSTRHPSYVDESLHPMRFFMNRVGGHALIALLYEKNDTLSDIYVKTLNMDGKASGVGGNDLGANFCSPNLVKIICDRESAVIDDCAILWTEISNTVHGEQGTAHHNGDSRMILNASRISMQPSFCVTSPLTMGADTEGRFMSDFDGFLDDQHLKVVYSLNSLNEDEPSVIRQCERYFENSFVFDVNYTKSALLGSSSLPVRVTIFNTGTSPIRNVRPTINGQEFTIDDSWVQPLSQRSFIVPYPIDSNFDGYLETSVQVDYQNVFRATRHAAKRGRSLLTQKSELTAKARVALEDVELRVIGQDIENGTNTFSVELIDHSPNGLRPDNVIHVGLFSKPMRSSLIADGAEALVRASDFQWFGGVRKAYAKVTLPGVTETTNAFLACHIIDETIQPEDGDNYVENVRYTDNIHYVYLQPSNNPTDINPVYFDHLKNTLDVKVSREEGGVRVSGLPVSDNGRQYRLRLFGSDGTLQYTTVSHGGSLFIPLEKHDVYLLSTGKDVLKFNF